VVFTLPHLLNALVDANRRLLLGELFAAVAWVLEHFAADPRWRLQGQLGFLALLHTWTQRLREHFHVHCIVPGGVWQSDRRHWVSCHRRWLFRKDSMAKAFRTRFLHRLVALRRAGTLRFTGAAAPLAEEPRWDRLLRELAHVKWIVYSKPAPGGPQHVLDYLGRYTHKVAISDHRLRHVADGQVTYTWRNRDDHNRQTLDTLPAEEFIHRFLYHVLPPGFQKIRYYGWLSATQRKALLPAIRQALQAPAPDPEPETSLAERVLARTGVDITRCPYCGRGHLRDTGTPIPRAQGSSP